MSIMAKMKSLLPLVVWILLDLTYIAAQGGGIGFGIRREIFFLNLEDGYFGCQVNQSTDVLQLYELSRLCDGVPDCYLGSDELRKELKCTKDCVSSDGTRCQNGACLDSLCHCNDGFGGCSCEVPDENECKYRPCDVFAHCTNSLGSFHCSCYPGYTGDGFHCQDINECDNPALASRCVANAECCNLPAHFLCKCRPGFEGDGEVQCTDINECAHPNACGVNALCQNYPGNYTCSCQPGYTGNPFEGCIDIDECQHSSSSHPVCGPGARCSNFPGGYHCECPPGYAGDAFTSGCVDADECVNRPCGKDALCSNQDGSYTCTCPPGFIGDPFKLCSAIGCTGHYECPGDQACINSQCQDPCLVSNPCQNQQCQVRDHQPVCLQICQCQKNSDCGFNQICDGCNCNNQYVTPSPVPGCEHCPPGISCDPSTGACAKAPGSAKVPRPCQSDLDCADAEACYGGQCEDLCAIETLCAPSAKCHVVKHRPVCTCPQGYEGNPATKCYLPHPLGCLSNEECSSTEACINSQCQKPCAVHSPCAPHAVCVNKNHASECVCGEGFQGNGFVGCLPVRNYQPICQYNEDCPPDKLCDRLNRICVNPCQEDSCGDHAVCVPQNHGIDCQCESGHQGNPYIACLSVTGCKSDSECPDHEGCVSGKCSNPCRCGPNAVCDVTGHKAHCKCLPGYTGNPLKGCLPPSNPCSPNPCGYHALCEVDNGSPVCFCPKGMTGNPFKSCIPEGDECSPNPCGPYTGCRVVSGSAVCFCLPEYVGDPPTHPCTLPTNPCHSSPCGPNTQCSLLDNGFAQCTCLPGYVESPNTIRGCVERRQPCEPNICGAGAVCDPNRAPYCFCPEGTVGNAFKHCGEPIKSLCLPGPCGSHADCFVTANTEQCYCKPGFQGDPYSGCTAIQTSACYPNPCGLYASCHVSPAGAAQCICPDGMAGDPHKGCSGPECTVDDNCPLTQACIGFRCRDPCLGACGFGATCKVEKHHPVCSCSHGLSGNPLIRCSPIQAVEVYNPCHPSPCGLNTICSVVGGRPVCSCLDYYGGDPKRGCRVECMSNGQCPGGQACVQYRCKDPCSLSNVCGLGAVCSCKNHSPTCQCREGFVGDPFIQCTPQPYLPPYPSNDSLACTPNPCDPHSTCSTYSTHVAMCDPCSGPSAPWLPGCRPECLCNSDCPFSHACLGQKCRNPCEGTCGVNALCTVVHHTPACYCPEGTVGNPYEHCATPIAPYTPKNPCDNVYCGSNAICKHINGIVTCECLPDYHGNGALGCRPECVLNTDCPNNAACVNNRCGNPCRSACGVGAMCSVVNHQPVCFCPQDTSGDPFLTCYPYSPPALPPVADRPSNPCDPNPCGPYSKCLIGAGGVTAVCSCLGGYRGSPPACKPECVISAECPQTQACVNWKCQEVCAGICAVGATCLVVNHNPICQCPPGHVGDPFVSCYLPPAVEQPKVPSNPCSPDLCGPNSLCKIVKHHPVCSCKENYIGNPPYCRPECVVNQECPGHQACIKERCLDPCPGLCGPNAKCTVVNHTPLCTCVAGYQGDAFVGCSPIVITVQPEQPRDPCALAPCGVNAQCSSVGGVARCSCIPPYQGNPYTGGCRPECSMNSDCPPALACISSHCRDPCPNVCGVNAQCSVLNHVPSCACVPGYVGDPFQSCRPEPSKPIAPQNPCEPSPCGPNSRCQLSSRGAVCSCLPAFIGAPPACRPQCVVSAECDPSQACVGQRCADACTGVCGLHARCTVVNHNPICSCPENLVGDPFVRCYEETPRIPDVPENPCLPSPCGPNADCRVVDHHPVCSCVVGMLGAPPHCRPECLLHADCPNRLACLGNKCKDPCLGTCGFHAQCSVVNHQPQCSCETGYQGDPFTSCSPVPAVSYLPPEPANPCQHFPCGPNAICRERHGAASCTCLPEYFGDPYTGCRPECVMNSDCARSKACVNSKCVDPCARTCGLGAECKTVSHVPNCYCPAGYTGNPLAACHPVPLQPTCHVDLEVELMKRHPCMTSPCGPYSQCRAVNDQAACSCLPGYYGSPPRCRPECTVSSDCNHDKTCINQMCTNPCLDHLCAANAVCKVINHSPICACLQGYTGDPFVRCLPVQHEPAVVVIENRHACVPSPCGPNSVCRSAGRTPICSCAAGYIGRPPHCRPECTINAECAGNLACVNERCTDPCPGSCGRHAVCAVVSHSPVCSCESGYSGDPFIGCSPYVEVVPTEGPRDPCVPNPCGANALCRERNGAGSCVCLPEYFGDPYTGCRPECVINSDCDRSKACVNNKCRDPCVGTCGINAECRVINHAPSCSCFIGYVGDPLSVCNLPAAIEPERPKNPCVPSPCGPYSVCRESNGHAVCSCQTGYIGAPPSCKPECMVSSECAQDKACVNQKCVDPCVGVCGVNARCQVINHNPICSCTPGFTGDAFVRCLQQPVASEPRPSGNPCLPSPCGPNSVCRVIGNTPACSCVESYIGRPPNCRPECTINAECAGNLACINERCKDPCPGSCGAHASCVVLNHTPRCTCNPGYSGDPFSICFFVQESPVITPTEGPRDPCVPNPCGSNALCRERNGAGSCVCLPEYFGDPYTGCRPECVINSDCDRSKACVNNKCRDPCVGTCGINAECRVINHAPSCSCFPGYTGDPLSSCILEPPTQASPPSNPCQPSPCGPYSVCRESNGHAVCSCQTGYIGAPPSCKPECMVSSECAQDKACVNQKCVDPCVGVCGVNARCQVVNHNPLCSCSAGFTGDPFIRCTQIQLSTTPATPINPCDPSPCGPNSQCRIVGDTAACTCLPNYIGRPPSCRPECIIHAECASNLACVTERCVDPCSGACGAGAACRVINHNAVCTCPPGTTGDATAICRPLPTTTERSPAPSDPCFPPPCGLNAECSNRNGVGSCACRDGFFGDPYTGCRRECEVNDDCAPQLSCIGFKCVDPCPGTCGTYAECTVVAHVPVCACPQGYTGDPFAACRPVPIEPITQATPIDPCQPSPCGPNSQCRPVNGQPICSCLANYQGVPPNCRPECVVNSECPTAQACINQRCADPCPNTCGLRAQCTTKNHTPICACPSGYTGDPFQQCSPIPPPPLATPTERPPSCVPSPCGPNSACQIINRAPVCSCLPDHIGAPPTCRPECVLSAECPSHLACINNRCRDPCPGSCGSAATCHVTNHVPVCACLAGYTGDPFLFCSPIPVTAAPPPAPSDPCYPSPCGSNAQCSGQGQCTCLPEYTGNPYEGCRPECVINAECPRDTACLRNKCRNPCPGTCGQGAVCDIVNHIPVCSCPQGTSGDPFTICRPVQQEPLPPQDVCSPSPCGPNSQCRSVDSHAVCSCLAGYIGTPPACRPECVVSSECSPSQACVSMKCGNPCDGACGIGARCEVINHSPICSCPPGQTGDSFRRCYPIPPPPPAPTAADPPANPCNPSPCGPNAACVPRGSEPSCSCLPNYIGAPPNCRPECVINPDCPSSLACINARCKDPCPGACGLGAHCQVIAHRVSCVCDAGYTGDPFVQCFVQQQEPVSACASNPCGPNAECRERGGAGACICLPEYFGNPYEGCRPECVLSSDCGTDKACVRNRCVDPCPGVCGYNAECTVVNHVPSCNCAPGFVGDPFAGCHPQPPPATQATVLDPCNPSPCGPNSQCRAINGQGVCSCLPTFIGSPPSCRPECTINAECASDRACYKFKCTDPCPGTCGLAATCKVINHNPLCSCPAGFTGDPFVRCFRQPPPPVLPPQEDPPAPVNPCLPSPCGPNSECRVINGGPSCSCRTNYIGQPPNCRPECLVNTDCGPTQACISEKCRDPCPGSCGYQANCRVQNHIPVCSCEPGFTGDPFTQCSQIIVQPPTPTPVEDPCAACGANTQCLNGVCRCHDNYQGDPYSGCRPECTMNSECSRSKACINQRCVDPCPGTCGTGAQCDVINHIPTCSCPPGTEGDAFLACRPVQPVLATPTDPCANPHSVCGPNAQCRVYNQQAVCSCLPGFQGTPPSCRPECVTSAECPLTLACIGQKCKDPCQEGSCGVGAKCKVVNHNPICSCPPGNTGDPFRQCYPLPPSPPEPPPRPVNPCQPSPCGPNAQCEVRGETAACSCLVNYIGSPPNCRPECTINAECAPSQACVNQRCADPCVNVCGYNAQCSVVNHTPVCACLAGFTGDPFTQCQIVQATPIPTQATPTDPCFPSPCGSNARCRVQNEHAVCECLPDYYGNPYEGCRPECLINSDCPLSLACIKNHCRDPCPGTCGVQAVCSVSNHVPICYCPAGFTGDAFRQCSPIPQREPEYRDPCAATQCGLNAVCSVNTAGVATCSCLPGYFGSPLTTGCRLECVLSGDCPRNRACVRNKCVDPCPGVCGYRAACDVINHSPVCSCPAPLQGDPFVLCQEVQEAPQDPCIPSPCGQNGVCRIHNGLASCSYPECVINPDCPRNRACVNQHCRDICAGACGINAVCAMVNHGPVCSCPPGWQGDPRVKCSVPLQEPPKPECVSNSDCANDKACINSWCKNPCSDNVCAHNAQCSVQMHRPICSCRDGLTGDANVQCYEIGCLADSECPPSQACVSRQCIDPCAFTTCGQNAMCRVDYNHRARCYCPENYFGDPQVRCERPQCLSDSECPAHLACINQRCADPCDCAPTAQCQVINHAPQCTCPPGYLGNPKVSCALAPLPPSPQCTTDGECGSKLACFSGSCRNPCLETRPCGPHASCSVVDTLPLRTMTCTCEPGFVGDADVECRLGDTPASGCSSNDECAPSDVCINRLCVNLCRGSHPCAPTAQCSATNHRVQCACPPGLVGDPFVNCYAVPQASPECTTDSECPSTFACINSKCQDPCVISQPCGISAQCLTLSHRPTCHCPDGWAGNPQQACYRPECKVDSDCLYDKACQSGSCVNPCVSMSCGRGAQCIAQAHRGLCTCPPGTQGDAQVACVSVGCQYNEDCADHESCDRLNRACRPVCDADTCAVNARCDAHRHAPSCTCLPGYHGNAYVQCLESRTPAVSVECTQDSQCPSQSACVNTKCVNPCTLGQICGPDQECRVTDSLPLRTVMCLCPPDTIATQDGLCRRIVAAPQCRVDQDCRDTDRCVQGTCLDACRIDACGLNAQCISRGHQSHCSCPAGYAGNPHVECAVPQYLPPAPQAECTRDDECHVGAGCVNQRCVNPCASDVCAPAALCHVERHQPVCHCPPGYSGNPRERCVPPAIATTGCTSNSECTPSEACVNRLCVSPCNCGPQADCRVVAHYPSCYCRPGYSGNPLTGCVKTGCESDEQCANDKRCYNGQCVNPCILDDLCAVNAQCYADNHRAQCRCPPGYQGSPYERCERVECQVDTDCPLDKTCQNTHCVNPCTDAVSPPCANNALCYVRNHLASCRCPEHTPLGNPLTYCERTPLASPEPECRQDRDCPSQHACISSQCVNPCVALSPCAKSARCEVLDSLPVRTMVCTCPEGWVPDNFGECKPVIVPSPPGCVSDSECSSNQTCMNRMCRNPCDCGLNAQCFVSDHRPVCSCKEGYDGNPNIACKPIGCRSDSECESGRACVNGNCINPCLVKDPCGPNAECFAVGARADCRCLSGYRGNPFERCHVVGCRSNNDCPDDRACINSQCINPCVYEHPCSPRAECTVQNHLALCRCPVGFLGNPYTACRPEPQPECKVDTDCPSLQACLNARCQNPCTALRPCNAPSECQVLPTAPVRTMMCICPPGFVSSGSGTCKATPPLTAVGCTADSQCPEDRACVNGRCVDPCHCAAHAQCRLYDHKPVCSCLPGYEGNPELRCELAGCRADSDCAGTHACINRNCVPACQPPGTCGTNAECYGVAHRPICECPPGLSGNPNLACVLVECSADSDCAPSRACVNAKCRNPCIEANPCKLPAECSVYNHRPECVCPPGYVGDARLGCEKINVGCRSDSECPSQTACINSACVNPCNTTEPCGIHGECTVFDTLPVRTMICECEPGYQGNAAVQCDKVPDCPLDKGYVIDATGACVCPVGFALTEADECRRCLAEAGFTIDKSGRCVCDLSRGLIINERGECVCPEEHGYRLDIYGNCNLLPPPPECESNDQCADTHYCNLDVRKCVDACTEQVCGVNAFCNATNHRAYCQCITGYVGDAYVYCNATPPIYRDVFPKPEIRVVCLADGVQVDIHNTDQSFSGVLYVKGHSHDERCRKIVAQDTPSVDELFKVNFGECGLIHINGEASFILVIQKHPQLVTYKAQAYHIKCVYATKEQNVTLGFNVSMLTTAGTIANTGPPPTCLMKIVTRTGQEINSATVGDNLMLQVDVQPNSIYGGFARSCIAKTVENNVENEYIVTDENGCATDPSIFGDWSHDGDSQSLLAAFNAFKFPSSDNIRFQCNIRVCFGRCQPVNCRGYDAYGRRRRRDLVDITQRRNNSARIMETAWSGQLREEITIESNPILTFEPKEGERYSNPMGEAIRSQVEDICISIPGLIVALIITALLALVAVAIAVSCWLLAYRRPTRITGPLPHPPEFPNPLFSHPEPVPEPTPDYLL